MHANRQMMWQIKPEAIPLSWTLVQVQTCLTELQKVTANILNPPVSVPVNAFSLQKPLSSSYHVFLCIFWRYEPYRPYQGFGHWWDRQIAECYQTYQDKSYEGAQSCPNQPQFAFSKHISVLFVSRPFHHYKASWKMQACQLCVPQLINKPRVKSK